MVFMVNEKMYNSFINWLDKKAYEEAAKRLKLENEREKEMVIPQMRIESRCKYLEKRKDDKVTELEADTIDDEYLFDAKE